MGKDSQKVLPGGPIQDELTSAIEKSDLVSAPGFGRLWVNELCCQNHIRGKLLGSVIKRLPTH